MSNIYARTTGLITNAVLTGLYSFSSYDDALDLLNSLRAKFTLSKQTPDREDAIVLWIKGYDITKKEKNQGYLGNFALIEITEKEKGKFTLSAQKLDSELRYHPQRKRQKHPVPNWGHPLLRAVKSNKIYPKIEEVQQRLTKFQEEFPQSVIPGTGKLYVMIYSKSSDPKKHPIKRYILEIKAHKEGGYYVDCVENTFEKTPRKQEEPPEAPDGYFTSMINAKRAGKRKTSED